MNFASLERATQIRFQLKPVTAHSTEGRPERLDAIAAEPLGLEHG